MENYFVSLKDKDFFFLIKNIGDLYKDSRNLNHIGINHLM